MHNHNQHEPAIMMNVHTQTPQRTLDLKNIAHVKAPFLGGVCNRFRGAATAALYIKQSSMWIVVCPNVAVLHSYLSLLMEFNDVKPTRQRGEADCAATAALKM